MQQVATQEALLFRLLFDEEARERFVQNRGAFFDEEGVDDDTRRVFAQVSAAGLEADAAYRRDYVMSTLCRAFPLTVGMVGTRPEGRRALTAFLSSPSIFKSTRERNDAFAVHLERVVDLGSAALTADEVRLLLPVFATERARLRNAAELRAHVERQGAAGLTLGPAPKTGDKKRLKVALPPFFLAGVLPFGQRVLQNALDDIRPENAWPKIAHGHLAPERVQTVARSLHLPVTFVQRGVVRRVVSSQAPGVPPLVEVTHLSAELPGQQGDVLQEFDGKRTLQELPHPLKTLATPLVDGQLLALV